MNTQLLWRLLASTVIMLTLATSPLLAEEPIDNSEYPYCCQGDRYYGRRDPNFRWYDSEKVEILEGKITNLDGTVSRRGSTFQGTHFMMETAQETIEVHVAPSWYLEEQDFDLSPQAEIVVVGSRINIDGKQAIIAREIQKGNETLTLRDQNGIPMWRGSRR